MFVFIANILKPHGNNLGRCDIFLYYIKQMKINFKPNCLQLCKGIQSILYSIVNKQIKLHAQLLSIQGRTVGTKNNEATTYLPTIVFGGVNDSSIYINLTTHSSKTRVHIINYTQAHICIHCFRVFCFMRSNCVVIKVCISSVTKRPKQVTEINDYPVKTLEKYL